ncbi:fungal cellulose binding protein domain protein [Sporothrix schenckii 1099-18]|uniref:feruloyl esterase n=1 Tax=Sporothrix schenckii 1099-18 TaxID=1397361 RepID=A0A0F2M1S7_SPOSC|nr:fungal cellulose binding protein domain protein [Sporothrix schenckii 1099-18]KJR83657.1 fungal cellulose binding protein domain protein [Sporothrix schenckii 1099-18]
MQVQIRFIGAVVLLGLSLLGAALADKSAGCGKDPTMTNKQYTMTVNGKQREYIMKLPDHYDKNRPYRLIFTWHPRGGSATKIVQGEDIHHGGALPYYGLPPLANNSAIFVVPNGLNNGWANSGGEDLTFFDQMVKAVEADLCVDTTLRFSTGFSYGAAMSYAIACARPQVVRAVAILSGAQLSGCSGGTDPVPYYGQHGTSDSVLQTSMGRSLRDHFVKNNGCTPVSPEPMPNNGKSVKTVYQGCKQGYPVTWVIHKGDHNPSETDPGSSTPFAPGNTWEFFSQFTSV